MERTSSELPGRDAEPRSELRVAGPRCAYCHTDVRKGELQPFGCGSCLAFSHFACWEEHGACPACGGAPSGRLPKARRAVRAPALAQATPAQDEPWWEGRLMNCRGCGDAFVAAERFHRYHCPTCVSPLKGLPIALIVFVLAAIAYAALLLSR